jgi:hypothetical protein
MRDPVFLLQAGEVLTLEKAACCFSCYPIQYCKFGDIAKLNPEQSKLKFVPVGSVEFTKEYANHIGIGLPSGIWSFGSAIHLFMAEQKKDYVGRDIRIGKLKDAEPNEFVKPTETKLFTGCVKSEVDPEIDSDTEVLISNFVPFESEYRFYIQDYVNGPKVCGWARYDDGDYNNPSPEEGGLDLVEKLAQEIHNQFGPNAYSIDIGWRPDLDRFSVVEVNDAWALGLYQPSLDYQSNPPSRQEYADMLISRWTQILFCALM